MTEYVRHQPFSFMTKTRQRAVTDCDFINVQYLLTQRLRYS